ncbi:MAG: putative transposase [Mycobacterium sp.]
MSESSQLAGMPARYELWRGRSDGEVVVGNGPMVLFRFAPDDRGMRNLAMVALSDAGVAANKVAVLFGVSPEHLSRLRSKVASHGSAALVAPMGAPRKLGRAHEQKVLRLAEQGHTGAQIAARFSVSEATISRLLARARGQAVPMELVGDEQPGDVAADEEPQPAGTQERGGEEPGGDEPGGQGQRQPDAREAAAGAVEPAGGVAVARIGGAELPCRYAGSMLLHPFLSRLGADAVLGELSAGPARRYDASSLVLASTFCFALGASSMEGSKHLVVKDAGALLGAEAFPHLRTLRPKMKALAEATDPMAVQRAFATAMLTADEHPPELFYIDDHFVSYWGKAPVAKGYNIRRHLAEPGRDDTFVVDDAWRAVLFASGEPRGLSVSLPEILGELRAVVGERRVMVGFDRGGSYPKVFSALAEAGMDWVTWRRAPLVPPGVEPARSWVNVDGKRRTVLIADELVELDGYDAGAVRQLSAYETGKVAFQVLTSNIKLKGAPMVHKLRGRWCIENSNKYLEDHQGIHWLCTYEMNLEANTAKVANPARTKATAQLRAAKASVSEAERALGAAMDANHANTDEYLSAIAEHRDHVVMAKDDLAEAKAGLKGVPAKVPANSLEPNAKRAQPALAARALQMVCRLLAYNAELDLARRVNNYLADPDEYRAITRNLLHLGGRITYRPRNITVNLDTPDSPRIARALGHLVEEINAGPPAHIPGDHRPITYQIAMISS